MTDRVQEFFAALLEWAAALETFRAAQLRVAAGVHPARPAEWAAALSRLGLAAGPPAGPANTSDFAAAVAAAAALGRMALATSEAARVILDPGAFARTGQTETEDRRAALRAAAGAAAAAAGARRRALAAAGAAGAAAPAGAWRAVAAADRFVGEVATEAYVCALRCAESDSESGADSDSDSESASGSAAALAAAADGVLGIAPDSAAAVARDTTALAQYHVLQRLNEEVPGLVQGADARAVASETARAVAETARAVAETAQTIVDISLPQASFDIEYDLTRLIDRRRATEFGAIAPMTAGLSHRLVERLRTIRAAPRTAHGAAPQPADGAAQLPQPPARVPAGEPLRLRVAPLLDGDCEGALRVAPPRARARAPFAGARPRAAALAAAGAAAGTAALAAAPWPPAGRDLRAEFDAKVRDNPVPAGAPSRDELLAALAAAFEGALAAAPPADRAAYYEAAAGESAETYITAALARIAAAHGSATLQIAASALQVGNSGGGRSAGLARELRLTRMLTTIAAARDLRRQLAEAFARLRPDYAELGPAGEVVQRAALMAGWRRAAAAAVAATTAAPIVPSLKLYSATLAV